MATRDSLALTGEQRAGRKLVSQDAAYGVPQGTLLLGEGEGVAGGHWKPLLTQGAAARTRCAMAFFSFSPVPRPQTLPDWPTR